MKQSKIVEHFAKEGIASSTVYNAIKRNADQGQEAQWAADILDASKQGKAEKID